MLGEWTSDDDSDMDLLPSSSSEDGEQQVVADQPPSSTTSSENQKKEEPEPEQEFALSFGKTASREFADAFRDIASKPEEYRQSLLCMMHAMVDETRKLGFVHESNAHTQALRKLERENERLRILTRERGDVEAILKRVIGGKPKDRRRRHPKRSLPERKRALRMRVADASAQRDSLAREIRHLEEEIGSLEKQEAEIASSLQALCLTGGAKKRRKAGNKKKKKKRERENEVPNQGPTIVASSSSSNAEQKQQKPKTSILDKYFARPLTGSTNANSSSASIENGPP